MQFLAEKGQINSALPVSDENLAGRPPSRQVRSPPSHVFIQKFVLLARLEYMRFLYFYIYFLFFKSCLMVPKLRLKTQSKKAERVKAENQYFPYSTLIRRAMVEAYCPTLVELVFLERNCNFTLLLASYVLWWTIRSAYLIKLAPAIANNTWGETFEPQVFTKSLFQVFDIIKKTYVLLLLTNQTLLSFLVNYDLDIWASTTFISRQLTKAAPGEIILAFHN